MAGNSSGQDLNQAFLFYNQSNQVGSSSSQNDSLEELQPTTEVTWPLNGSQEAADPWSLVTASPLPVPDWLGLHKMLLEFSGLQLPPILVSPVLLVLAMAASELAYRLVLSHVLPGNVRSVLLDFLAAGGIEDEHRAMLRAQFTETGEETGSPGLAEFCAQQSELLAADVVVLAARVGHRDDAAADGGDVGAVMRP